MNKSRKQSDTTYPLFFFMVDSTDHVTGKTGLSPTVTISKNGGSFASPSGAVTEVGNGLYKVAGNATDSNTVGELWIHATGTAADPTDTSYTIVAYDPFDAVRLGLTALPNAAAEASGGLYTRGSGAGQINQPANGQIDANTVKVSGTTQTARDLGASVLLSSGTGTGQLDITSGVVKSNMTQIDGLATSGNNATLNLKKLAIVNSDPADAAVEIRGSGTGTDGLFIQGNGAGAGAITIDTLGGSYSVQLAGDMVGAFNANLTQIDGNATNGNNAALKLKTLSVINNSGTAVDFKSTAGNGKGLNIEADPNSAASGISSTGGYYAGHGIEAIGGGGDGSYGIQASGVSAGINGLGGANGHGISASGNGSGCGIYGLSTYNASGIRGESSGAGNGIQGKSQSGAGFGATALGSGNAIDVVSASGNGISIIGGGSAKSITLLTGSFPTYVKGSISGNIVGTIDSLATQAKADVNAEVKDVLETDTQAEPTSPPASTASLKDKIAWLFTLGKNKRTQTTTTETVLADDGTTPIATSAKSDTGTTFTRGKFQ